MGKFIPILIIVTVFAILGGSIFANMQGGMSEPIPVPVGFVEAETLDGRTYAARLDSLSDNSVIRDRLVFEDGHFLSEECRRRCDYPASPYFVSEVAGGLAFFSQSICHEKNARIVWRGWIDGHRIHGTFTWTSERWYWSVEREFPFKGRLIEAPGKDDELPLAGSGKAVSS